MIILVTLMTVAIQIYNLQVIATHPEFLNFIT